MAAPQLIQDFMRVMLLLAPSAAIICLVLAGLGLRQSSIPDAVVGGNFAKWMFWAIVFLTLPQLISWFPSVRRAGVSAEWRYRNWVAGELFRPTSLTSSRTSSCARLATSLAAFLCATRHSRHRARRPSASFDSRRHVHAGDSNDSHADEELQQRHSSMRPRTCSTACGIISPGRSARLPQAWPSSEASGDFVTRRPVMPMVGATIGLLTVSAIWTLITKMM